MYPKFTFYKFPFLGPIYPHETKNIAKNQNLPRTYNLSTIKLHKTQVPHKSQNSYIINKKNHFLDPKWAEQEGYCHNFFIQLKDFLPTTYTNLIMQ